MVAAARPAAPRPPQPESRRHGEWPAAVANLQVGHHLGADRSFGSVPYRTQEKPVMKNLFASFIKNESGATAIEYGLIGALISVVIIVAVKLVGSNLSGTFDKIAQNLT
jgi:pilus assembly protein Flp/PilA